MKQRTKISRKRTQHTPTPYTVVEDSLGSNPDIHIHAKGYGFVAEIGGGLLETRRANAKFIVRACNSHHPMVEMLDRLITELLNIRFSNWPKGTSQALGITPEGMDELLREAETVHRRAKRR